MLCWLKTFKQPRTTFTEQFRPKGATAHLPEDPEGAKKSYICMLPSTRSFTGTKIHRSDLNSVPAVKYRLRLTDEEPDEV